VEATLAMARLMVESGRSSLPWVPRRVVAVFQPHRYSRTADFMDRFAEALTGADTILLAPLYSAGEAPIKGVSSEALAARLHDRHSSVQVSTTLEELAEAAARTSREGDLLLVMGAGDVNRLWDLLARTVSAAG
jgi:UDP-N-acetylmuramate--alanine ligase